MNKLFNAKHNPRAQRRGRSRGPLASPPTPKPEFTPWAPATCSKCSGYLIGEYTSQVHSSAFMVKCMNCGAILYHPLHSHCPTSPTRHLPQ